MKLLTNQRNSLQANHSSSRCQPIIFHDFVTAAQHEIALKEEQQPGGVSRAKPRLRQRPFRQLEAFMLGNTAGPLKASPNSIRPILINNEHFQGLFARSPAHLISQLTQPSVDVWRIAISNPAAHTRIASVGVETGVACVNVPNMCCCKASAHRPPLLSKLSTRVRATSSEDSQTVLQTESRCCVSSVPRGRIWTRFICRCCSPDTPNAALAVAVR